MKYKGDSAVERIAVDDLRIGMYVRLEAGWLDHPFFFNNFKIKNQGQIDTLKESGIDFVIYVPEKSDPIAETLESAAEILAEASEENLKDAERVLADQLRQEKQDRIEKLRETRHKLDMCQQQFNRTADQVKKVLHNLKSVTPSTVEAADALIKDVVENLFSEEEFIIYLMNTHAEMESSHYHALNVMVLALMLGKEFGIDDVSLRQQSLGALFHDIGKQRIPNSILNKKEPLKYAETKYLQQHPLYGYEMVSDMQSFPEPAKEIVRDHHETLNGKGYPSGLTGDQISLLTQIVTIANVYDNLCNNGIESKDELTPYEALAYMFSKKKDHLSQKLLSVFVRRLGVYPPGTLVQLSDGMTGIVVSPNPENSLRPSLVIYDPQIPKNDALVIDMVDMPELKIEKSLSAKELPVDVHEYMGLTTRVSYFFDSAKKTLKS